MIVGTKMKLVRFVEKRGQEVHKRREAEAPREKRPPETCMCCEKEGHKKADCKFKSATCSTCSKVGHLRAVCRNTNTHEVEEDADEPRPGVTV